MKNHSATVPVDDEEPQRDGPRPEEPRHQAFLEHPILAEDGPPRHGWPGTREVEKAHERHTGDQIAHQDGRPTELAHDVHPGHCEAFVKDQIVEPKAQDQPQEYVRCGVNLGEGPRYRQADANEGAVVKERV